MTAIQCSIPDDLSGRTALVTGSTSGIGFELAKELLKRRCDVVVTGRTQEKCEKVVENLSVSLNGVTGGTAIPIAADLSNLNQVEKLADTLKRRVKVLDLLFLNAGMIYTPGFAHSTVSDSSGMDLLYTSNCLGQFLLTKHLLDMIEKSSLPGAIVFTGSIIQWYCSASPELLSAPNKFEKGGIQALEAYANSKLALSVFAAELGEQLKERKSPVRVRSFAPGMVKTSLKMSMEERKDVPSLPKADNDNSSWASMQKRFNASQAASYTLMAAFSTVDDAELEQNLHLMLLGPYRIPSFLFGASKWRSLSVVRTALLWLLENMQKLSASEDTLYVWPNPELVSNDGLRSKVWKDWDAQARTCGSS
mmetsp:Transcript_15605/g.18917  ORF Transcript_15605/g.18917 Transcript_15605/m.18917 type:complete len:364 (-) Transcript_15605:1247-2338(-)|eukprot:CAMPEP_0184038582 /NCGR_PEP_ID=MMETSP0955-20130417/47803_1 /TAXON_ID=627963 /ORGANISM="Aplanochytrium sp, Strain PBS07" /LENGTH=363 /DNA_ID=CAMNT_0026327297 /DNA_START=44 /DNA_END=1135 /DNA_ORIENTATION=+